MSNQNSPSHAYYSFPPTPSRSTGPARRRRRLSLDSDTESDDTQRPRTKMAPSPAAGKTATGGAKTPTKLSRKPQAAAGKLNTPKPSEFARPETDSQLTLRNPEDEGDEHLSKVEMKDASEAPTSEAGIEEAEGDDEDDGPLGKATKATSEAKDELKEQAPEPIRDEDEEEAEETGEDLDTPDVTDKNADTTAGEETDEAEAAVEETPKKAAGGLVGGAKGLAGKTADLAGKATKEPTKAVDDVKDTAEETVGGAKDTVGDAKDTVGEQVNGAKDTVEETTGQELPQVPDLSILEGLEVDANGDIFNEAGKKIGHLVEGDAEDLEGYKIGDNGEILDDDGDLVGRCELLDGIEEELSGKTEDVKSKATGTKDAALGVLKGLTVDFAGNILNADGDTVGQLVEGDPEKLQGREFNANGEILDDAGNVIGRAKIHPDAPKEVVEQVKGATGAAQTGATEAAGKVQDTVGQAQQAAGDASVEPELELPGVELLEGRELNSEGNIVDDEGNVLGQLAEGSVTGVKGLTVNDQGEVLDADGNVVGKVELAEGAAEKLKDTVALDLRILEGLKLNKKGKVLDAEGEEIGKLVEGEPSECAGKVINAHGEIKNAEGKVIGKVEIVPGEAAEEATRELKSRLADVEEPQIKEIYPDLQILDGLKVNKKGKILNEDGEPIGELVEGDAAACAGKKVNDKGEVLDNGKVIGKVKTLAQQAEVAADELKENAGEAVDDAGDAVGDAGDAVDDAGDAVDDAGDAVDDAGEAVEEAASNLPPLSILEGLKVNKAGKLINNNGTVVGELVEGDPKKLSKLGTTCDDQGQFWDNKGHVIGRAQTVEVEEPEEEAPFAGLDGLIVNRDGYVEDENGNIVGRVTEGNAKKLVGRAVDEDGDILDKRGSVVGHAERYEEEEVPEVESEPIDLSQIIGKTVNKQGNVIGDEGVPIGRLVQGNPKEVAGRKIDENGQIWNDSGKVIGRVELIPEEEREKKPEGPFAGLQGLRVVAGGKIADEDDNIVGEIVEGNPKRLVGLAVDEDGDIIDRYGNVKGHAEPLEDEPEAQPADLSILDGLTLNKQGFLVGHDGIPIGRLVEGNAKELAGRKSDGDGLIHGDTGKVVGRCELLPDSERVAKPEGPFAGLEGLRVIAGGKVEDSEGNVVGVLTEGDPKKLVGHTVDEDGDIVDKFGNVKGHAEPYEEPEEPEEAPVDLSSLAGCTVNKAGNIVNSSGAIVGRVADGDAKAMVGKKVDGKGQIWDNSGNVIGHAELVHGQDSTGEGPFGGFDTAIVAKDGMVVTPDGTIIGRVIEGDVKKLIGHKVDEDGDISDKNGNTIGRAERWEPEEKERRINPMSGRRVNKQGEVCDADGNVIGRLTAGDLGHCVGLEIDDNGYVVDNDGNKVGEVTLLENIIEEEEDEELSEEDKQKKQDAEIADKMAAICQQTLERIQPVCKQITEHIEKADRTPRDELDEEELVNQVKPLIEEGHRILQECNGSLRSLDPDGRIAAQAKGRSGTREATPEEYRLADLLKELTTTVVTTIDNAKKKISDMPHAKKKLNPLWSLLTQPLFQIIAAVGLLLTGVLGLVGQLLNALGLGGLVNGLLGGLGVNKLLSGLGLGSITESLGGGKKKKKSGGGVSNIPVIGGLLGGGKN